MIELWLEPGRALLDQAGLTLALVTGTKVTSAGTPTILLDMRRQNIAFYDREVFVDPVLLAVPQQLNQADDKGEMTFVAGNLCLESDLIFRRKIYFATRSIAGDSLVFVNTAGYMMDFSATSTVMRPPATTV